MPRYSQASLCAVDHDGAAITPFALDLRRSEGAARGDGSGSRFHGDDTGLTLDTAMTLINMMRFSIESNDFYFGLVR
jgi:hypothetical protein